MGVDEKRHKEIGIKVVENTRLVNQLVLQSISNDIDFFPHVLDFSSFDGSKDYQVERIDGETLENLMDSLKPSDFFTLLLDAAKQQATLYQKYGLIVKDRNKSNFIYGKKEQGIDLRLYQVDVESIFDAATGLNSIGLDTQLSQRVDMGWSVADARSTEIEIADVCDSIIAIAIEYLRKRKRDDREQKLYLKLHHMIGVVRIRDFNKLLNIIEQIRIVLG